LNHAVVLAWRLAEFGAVHEAPPSWDSDLGGGPAPCAPDCGTSHAPNVLHVTCLPVQTALVLTAGHLSHAPNVVLVLQVVRAARVGGARRGLSVVVET